MNGGDAITRCDVSKWMPRADIDLHRNVLPAHNYDSSEQNEQTKALHMAPTTPTSQPTHPQGL